MSAGDATTKQSASETFLRKTVMMLGKQEIQDQIQVRILDPLLSHVMKRVFPYIILTCVLFVLLLIVVMITLGIIVFQLRGGASPVAVAGG